jgi:hypothetical protein
MGGDRGTNPAPQQNQGMGIGAFDGDLMTYTYFTYITSAKSSQVPFCGVTT